MAWDIVKGQPYKAVCENAALSWPTLVLGDVIVYKWPVTPMTFTLYEQLTESAGKP